MDYADMNTVKEMTLTHADFARRFDQHILPKRFVKIRHCGFIYHRDKAARMQKLHIQMSLPPPMPKVALSTALRVMLKSGVDINICPICKSGGMKHEHTLIMYNGELQDITTVFGDKERIERYKIKYLFEHVTKPHFGRRTISSHLGKIDFTSDRKK